MQEGDEVGKGAGSVQSGMHLLEVKVDAVEVDAFEAADEVEVDIAHAKCEKENKKMRKKK